MTYNVRVILKTLAVVLLFEGVAMLPPMAYGIYLAEYNAASALFFPAICCIFAGLFVYRHLKYYTLQIKSRESFFVAFLCWILVSIVGTVPYFTANCGYSLIDSLFESISGWTTTGAWVIDATTMPRSLLLWKGISNWLGGMGLLLLTVSLFPVLGVQGQKMAAAEVPGPDFEKMSARISDTAKLTYRIYFVLTLIEFLLLLPSGLDPFHALVNTMSTISTAGFLSADSALNLTNETYVKVIFTFFSLAGSVNFMMYFLLYCKKWKMAFNMLEIKTYLALLAGGALVISVVLYVNGQYESFLGAFGDAFAQATAFGATSGYEIDNINLWPTTCKMVLLILVLIGGCGNSTSGSIKVMRFIIYFKIILRGVYKRIHPRAVKPIMIQGKPVSAATAASVTVFVLMYFAVFIFSSLVLALENQDMETTFSTVLACITNNGTAFGAISGGNFSIFSGFGKMYAAALMLAGRLELYAIIILFSRSFWNSDRARS